MKKVAWYEDMSVFIRQGANIIRSICASTFTLGSGMCAVHEKVGRSQT